MSEQNNSQDVSGDPEGLGDAGKKALQEERAARAEAEKRLREVEADLQAAKDRHAMEVAGLQEQVTAGESALSEMTRARDVSEVLLRKGLSVEDAGWLQGDSVEDLEASADRLIARIGSAVEELGAAVQKPPTPKPDKTQGAAGASAPTSTADQFAAAMDAALNN